MQLDSMESEPPEPADSQEFTPRAYQLELLEKAKRENLIVALATGTGKTFIAVMLIRECAEATRIPWEQGGKRSVFLVNQVALVKQQAQQIRTHTDLKVSEYSGGTCDLWTSDQWEKEFRENQVLVMTAQIFLNMITHGFTTMERANVIVFDECHHATKNHPYREIMREYKHCLNYKPRILGLTASVINDATSPSKLERAMSKLELALACRIETASDAAAPFKYGTKAKLVMPKCLNFDRKLKMFEPVRLVLADAVRFCKEAEFDELEINPTRPVITALERVLVILDNLGPWCAWRVCFSIERQLEAVIVRCITEQEIRFIRLGQTAVRVAKRMLGEHVGQVNSLETALQWLPHRIHKLMECLRTLNPNNIEMATEVEKENGQGNEFSAIIFVQQRIIAKTLKDCLKCLQNFAKDDYGYLKIDFVVGISGYNVSQDDEQSLHKRREEALKNFREKKLNLLIATSVVEEGVDIPQCNCVIRYDFPENYRSYVQSKGRARKRDALYIMLVDEKNFDNSKSKHKDYTDIEEVLLNYCQSKDAPEMEDIEIDHADHILPPYYPPCSEDQPMEGRPRVTMTTAIPLVNRYCDKLPCDSLTRLAPRYEVVSVMRNGMESFQGSLILPINSPVKEEIKGPLMPKKKYAAMATALEACKILHQRQELDRHLLPVAKESAVKLLMEQDDEELLLPGPIRPGTWKRRQYYQKKVADALTDARPNCNSPCFVHVIQMEPVKPYGGKQVAVWGILSKKPMPKIPDFPLYAVEGEMRVRIVTLPNPIQLDSSQLDLISRFHDYIFTSILRVAKKNRMQYDPTSAQCGVLIVPLKKVDSSAFVLDLPLVTKIVGTEFDLSRVPTEDERKKFQFMRESYMDAVVVPWYRPSHHPHFFIVLEIRGSTHPHSRFPHRDYANFNDYFNQKYDLTIYNQSQPMLNVNNVADRLNMILPATGRRYKTRPDTDATGSSGPIEFIVQHQLLPPELVNIHPIPASMWKMIMRLPTTLYRLNALLIADEWRVRVESEAFGRKRDLPGVFTWEPLVYDPARQEEPSNADCSNRENAGHAVNKDTFQIGASSSAANTSPIKSNGAASLQNDTEFSTSAGPDGVQNQRECPTAIDDDKDSWDNDDELYFEADIRKEFVGAERKSKSGENAPSSPVSVETGPASTAPPPAATSAMASIGNLLCSCAKSSKFENDLKELFEMTKKQLMGNSESMWPNLGSSNFTNSPQSQPPPPRPAVATLDFEMDHFDQEQYGPNPCLILKALTTCGANDGINLERFELMGDSFLKYSITCLLFNAYPEIHEGQLSFHRSKLVCNYNLYKLGKRKGLAEMMVASAFEPKDNWIPPGYRPLERNGENVGVEEEDKSMEMALEEETGACGQEEQVEQMASQISYSMTTQQYIADKSIADAVEAMIGVYLLTYGPEKTTRFLQWFGLNPTADDDVWSKQARSPLLRYVQDPEAHLEQLWQRYNLTSFESQIGYEFKDKAFLVQAFTHASYNYNRVTDCFQRLEFLGDAVLDYMITQTLFQYSQHHSPGVLTDLRSALVNNTIFASLAVKYNFHKHFMALSPVINTITTKFVGLMQEKQDASNFDDELYLLNEENCDIQEEIEVPKSLSDIFESVAGAIYLDSCCSLNAVWRVYFPMMKDQIEKCCQNPPKNPIRELMEMEQGNINFVVLGRGMDTAKVRVAVVVTGKDRFVGAGRSYRIAKNAAAKRALKQLKLMKTNDG